MAEYKIIWEGEPHPELEGELRADLQFLDISDIRNLITHTFLLTPDDYGPSISCYGDRETGNLFARYHDKTEWVTMDNYDAPPVKH